MPEQASKGKLRTPTRRWNGEGRANREATDAGSGSVRRGSGRGMRAKGVRSPRREAPVGGARNSNVAFEDGGPGGESDRLIVAKKRGNARGAKQPGFRHACQRVRGRGDWR